MGSEVKKTMLFILGGIIFTAIFSFKEIYSLTPLWIIKLGLSTLSTLMHEIGHSLFFWIFGYVAFPAFDFKHGGGFAIPITNQILLIQIAMFAISLYAAYVIGKEKLLSIILISTSSILFIIGFFEFHEVIYLFMGHGFETLVGLFFLTRALFNIAPRGNAERFLNGFFGIYLNTNLIQQFYLVANDSFVKDLYIHQKEELHIGDFSRIAHELSVSLESVCLFMIIFAIFGLLIPFAEYFYKKFYYF